MYCGDIMVGFSCAPDRGAHLARHARDVVKVLREHGPTEEEVNAVRECEIRDFEVSRQENSFWREYITELYKSRLVRKSLLDEDIDSLYQMTEEIRNEVIDALSPTLVRDHLKDVMSLNTSVTVVLKPQRSILKRIFVPSFETRGEALYSVAYLSGIALATSAIFARLKKDR
jgi:hypothetical protein